jgi:hypothetical protein
VTCAPAATRERRGPAGEAGHVPSLRSAPWCCASWRRTRPGDIGGCTGKLLTLGVTVAASTVWEILRAAGIDPAPARAATTWTQFLRSQAQALLAADFLETITLTGTRLYLLAVIEHASRRIRILGATTHPSAAWVTQTARNLVMDLEDAGRSVKYLIRDRDGKYPALFDTILADAGINVCAPASGFLA